MKTCVGCQHAKWHTTAAGRLHPSGDGVCEYPYVIPPLPASRVFIFGSPSISAGIINRRQELKDHCPYFLWKLG